MLNLSSIVLPGNFNPAIFHPEWFERFKILPIQETQWTEGPAVEKNGAEFGGRKLAVQSPPQPPLTVTPEYSCLTFKSLKTEVRRERSDCKTFVRNSFSLIKEVTLKIFSLPEHTPVRTVGINFEGHWKFSDDGQIILKRIFGCENSRHLHDTFGDSYKIGGRITTAGEDYSLTADYTKSNILEGGIFLNANYHRKVDSDRTCSCPQRPGGVDD